MSVFVIVTYICLYAVCRNVQTGGLFQLLVGRCQHQLNTVDLVNLGCPRIVVDCHNVSIRISLTKMLDNTLADNVVWQTGKWLCTDNICGTAVDQLDHFTC